MSPFKHEIVVFILEIFNMWINPNWKKKVICNCIANWTDMCSEGCKKNLDPEYELYLYPCLLR